MGTVNPRQIVENIESVLSGREPQHPGGNGASAPGEQRNFLWQSLEAGPLRQMRHHQAVDRIPEESRMKGMKRALARFFRIVTAPQAAYNFHNIEALEYVAGEVDNMRSRLELMENRIEHGMRGLHDRLDEMSHRHGTAVGELNATRSDLEHARMEMAGFAREFAGIQEALGDRAQKNDVAHLWREVSMVQENLKERAYQKDVSKLWNDMKAAFDALEQRANQNDVTLIWNELKVMHQSLSGRTGVVSEAKFWEEIEKIYAGINERMHHQDGTRLWNEVAVIHKAVEQRGSQADVARIFAEIQTIYKGLEQRGSQEDVARLFGEVQAIYAAIEERASKKDIPRVWEEFQSIYRAIEARASQEDMSKVWEEFNGLHANLKERAYQADVAKLWQDLKAAFDSVNDRASAADVSKLWSEVALIHENLKERSYQKDVTKLFAEMQEAFRSINDRAAQKDVSKLWVEVATLQSGIESRAVQAEVSKLWDQVITNQRALDERASQNDVSRLWTELEQVYKSIEAQVQNVWKGIEERDRQLQQNTTAAQHLHGQVGSLEAAAKELRARLLFLAEQLTLQEEEALQLQRASGPPPDAPTPPIILPIHAAQAAVPSLPVTVDPQLKKHLDLAYLRFQRQFRGEEADLRERQQRYIDLIRERLEDVQAPRVLDVACGDGIFLDLLKGQGWDCLGVDINDAMVKQGLSRNLPIEQHDALAFLDNEKANSYDAITAFQFVEHLQPHDIMRLLKSAYRVLRPHGILIVETINPHTMKALHWYHLDLTHARLLFPEMMELLAETAGFQQVDWKGINPVAESEKLTPDGTDTQRENVQKLNQFLFGDQDYYLVARRPGRPKKG